MAPVYLPDLELPVTNVPDSIDVAVGDLDKIPDQQGVNHDEVAIAYGSRTGELMLAVLKLLGPKLGSTALRYANNSASNNI